MSLLSLENLSVEFGKNANKTQVLKNINLDVEEKGYYSIVGKSGCGKTTLLNVLGGIIKPTSGSYTFSDRNINSLSQNGLSEFRNKRVGFVVQHFALIKDMSVFDNIALPLKCRGYSMSKISSLVDEKLQELNIKEKKNNFPYELSGGQCQRVAIARAIIGNPLVLLADEPTGSLDESTGGEIMRLFDDLNNCGMTIIMVTHDLEIAQRSKKVIHMADGQIV